MSQSNRSFDLIALWMLKQHLVKMGAKLKLVTVKYLSNEYVDIKKILT